MNKAAQKLGKLGGKAASKKRSKEEYKALGKITGEKNKLKGPEYFKEIGKKGAAKRWADKNKD